MAAASTRIRRGEPEPVRPMIKMKQAIGLNPPLYDFTVTASSEKNLSPPTPV